MDGLYYKNIELFTATLITAVIVLSFPELEFNHLAQSEQRSNSTLGRGKRHRGSKPDSIDIDGVFIDL